MKKCNKCGEEKGFDEFSKRSNSKDGLQYSCKSCMILYVKSLYEKKKPEKLDYMKRYYKDNPELIKSKTKKYQQNNPDKAREYTKKWSSKPTNKIKLACHKKEAMAVKNEKLINPHICELCGVNNVRIIAHHWDYSKPLNVVWCCDKCHKMMHADD